MPHCGLNALEIKTHYAGKNQSTHPNVICFDQPWNGYRYYMGFTPLPHGNGAEENPCVAASNDLEHWDNLPDKDAIRPIAWCEETACDELKDTHLLYREDLNRLELWYMGRIASSIEEKGPLYVFRKTSPNGREWSDYEVMLCFDKFNLTSPSILWNGVDYDFWGIRAKEGLYYCRVKDDGIRTDFTKCEIPAVAETKIWHGTVSLIEGKYTFVWVGTGKHFNNKIFYSESPDGRNFSPYQLLLTNDSGWDFLYRPCLIMKHGLYSLFYGVITHENRWLISKSTGTSLQELSGYSAKVRNPNYAPTPRSVRLRQAFSQLTSMISLRFSLLFPIVFIGYLYLPLHPIILWIFSVSFISICCVILRFRSLKEIISTSLINGTLLSCFATWVLTLVHSII